MENIEARDIRDKQILSRKMDLADRLVSKKYLSNLSDYSVKPLSICVAEDIIFDELRTGPKEGETPDTYESRMACSLRSNLSRLVEEKLAELKKDTNFRFLKLSRFVYSAEEDILQKLSTVYSSLSPIGGNIVFIIDCPDGEKVDIYIGVQAFGGIDKTTLEYSILSNALKGNFPGTIVEEEDAVVESINRIRNKEYKSLAVVSGVANERKKSGVDKKAFIQGLEKLIDSMKKNALKSSYTVMIVADSVSNSEVETIAKGYEELYTAISTSRKSVISTSASNSKAISQTITKGTSESISEGLTKTNTHTSGKFSSNAAGISGSIQKGVTDSVSRVSGEVAGQIVQDLLGAVGGLAGPIGRYVGRKIGGMVAEGMTKTITHAVSKGTNVGGNVGHSWGTSVSDSVAEAVSNQKSTATSESKAEGKIDTTTEGTTLQIESIDKTIVRVLETIDKQLERIDRGEPYGMFNCCAYFLSSEPETTLVAANTYKALLMGEKSSVESAAVNYFEEMVDTTTNEAIVDSSFRAIREYLSVFKHPVFYIPEEGDKSIECSAASLINGMELPLYMGIPQKSVNGLSVVEQPSFGRNIQFSDTFDEGEKKQKKASRVSVGEIYHMSNKDGSKAWIDKDMLTSHVFITGSTGSGKTNSVYQLLAKFEEVPKLIIEPAKGEYKSKIGADYTVYGTNPSITKLLRINPLSFPAESGGYKEPIHVLEHIDRLVEILNACWPMYAAMPAVLKDAIERAYMDSGWNLRTSKCSPLKFPTFKDVMRCLGDVLNDSMYSADTKSDYKGALFTRVKSLTNGINGLIFCSEEELISKELFEDNVIIDISRVGSSETKAFIMGAIIMRLQEYRLSTAKMSEKLEHITVIEEAHNLLRRTSNIQSQESANLQGKSVEMLSNSIAELRAYGESFFIVDQAPGLLDEAVIRNTNTKLVMRLPDANDREVVGRTMSLSDNQMNEMAKLSRGVCVLYQNDWIEAVLCKFEKFNKVGSYTKPGNSIQSEETIDYQRIFKVICDDTVIQKMKVSEIDEIAHWIDLMQVCDAVRRPFISIMSGKTLSKIEKNRLIYNIFEGKRVALLLLDTYNNEKAIEITHDFLSSRFGIEDARIVTDIINRIIAIASEYDQAKELSERFGRVF